MSLVLENFELRIGPTARVLADPLSAPRTEVDKVAAYEQGYQAGWDDAAQAEAEDQTRIGADFARNLQDLSFTFHEARAHVIQAMEPLLQDLIEKLLPELVVQTFGQKIIEELRPLIEDGAEAPIEITVAPASLAALEHQMADAEFNAIELREEPTLAEGQAFLRMGHIERQIDMTGALDRIAKAVRSLNALNERTLKHA